MTEFPFQLLIDSAFPKNKRQSLTCTKLLRTIAGRRQVYEAVWNGRAVIVKLFSHKINAGRHLKKEWRGLRQLQKRQLSCPVLLFYGKTENGGWAVVTGKIADCSTALEVFNEKRDPEEKLELLISVCRELAEQHRKGVLQKDLHLGNFLVSGDKGSGPILQNAAKWEHSQTPRKAFGVPNLFAIDPGQMRFRSQELTRKKSIWQLASVAAFLPEGDTKSIGRLCKEYASARGWHFDKSDEAMLQKQLTLHKKTAVKKGLKKCLRTSKRCLKVKTDKYLAVFDRGFCQGHNPVDFIKQVDTLMNEGQTLKNSRTCYVCRLRWNGKDVVVKRYNHKGFVHSLRHTIKRSRARRGWLHGHRLGMLTLPTPKPLAYIEQYRGPIVWTSYLATEYIEGKNLYNFLADDSVTEQQRSRAVKQIEELFDKLGRHSIAHGDLKHSNILITANGPTLTDLDAMKVYKWNFTYRIRQRKDLLRFSRLAVG